MLKSPRWWFGIKFKSSKRPPKYGLKDYEFKCLPKVFIQNPGLKVPQKIFVKIHDSNSEGPEFMELKVLQKKNILKVSISLKFLSRSMHKDPQYVFLKIGVYDFEALQKISLNFQILWNWKSS